MRIARLPHVVNGALLVLLFGGSLWLYPALPEQIPHHFDLYGRADAYWHTTLVRWMLLPGVAVFTAACLYGPAWLVGALPETSVNMPHQERYDALSSDEKHVVLRLVRQALYWMATAALIIILAAQVGVYAVATTPATALPTAVGSTILTGLLAIAGLAGWLVWGLSRRIRLLSDSDGLSEGGNSPEPAGL